MGKASGPGQCNILVFFSCIANSPPPNIWLVFNFRGFRSRADQGWWANSKPTATPDCSLSHSSLGEAIGHGLGGKQEGRRGQVTGPLHLCPCSCQSHALLFCPQWSQAAPMAEGEQKTREGKFPWLLDGILCHPRRCVDRSDSFFSNNVGVHV